MLFRSHGSSGAVSAAGGVKVESLSTLSEDCLQYPVETRADGARVWHADYVYYYLIDAGSHQAARDENGRIQAAGLLHAQAIAFMEAHPERERDTYWTARVARTVQVAKDGKVIEQSAVRFVDDFDLADLIARDAGANSN